MTEPEEDFAALFAASETASQAKRFERGQTIEGTIVAIGPEVAFVNVGGKGEALIEVAELKDPDGVLEVAVGDRIQAVVVSNDGGLQLSRKLARRAATDTQLQEAYEAGLPVEGKVEREIKGGYEIRIGRSRGFCPFSQIDVARNTTPADHLGRVYTFRITEFKDGGRNLVVSRRVLQQAERELQAVELRKTIVPGAVLTGHVASVREFGAFIELGAGVQGLLHVSEMGWSRVSKPAELVEIGQAITVKVLRVDEDGGKISLGLKQLSADPWLAVPDAYAVGQVKAGRVTRLADFGAFVEFEPGVEGLAHASTFPPSGSGSAWTKQVPVGSTAAFEILTIDIDKKRIGVALVPEGSTRAAAATASVIAAGARLTGTVERHESFGVFVYLAPGRTGLIPLSETGVPREGDVVKAFPVGSEVEVIVLEVDAAAKRIRLSRKAVTEAAEAEELRAFNARNEGPSSGGLGSLADKLRGALSGRKN